MIPQSFHGVAVACIQVGSVFVGQRAVDIKAIQRDGNLRFMPLNRGLNAGLAADQAMIMIAGERVNMPYTGV